MVLKFVELPSNKGIIVWINISSNEGTTPVDLDTEILKIILLFMLYNIILIKNIIIIYYYLFYKSL